MSTGARAPWRNSWRNTIVKWDTLETSVVIQEYFVAMLKWRLHMILTLGLAVPDANLDSIGRWERATQSDIIELACDSGNACAESLPWLTRLSSAGALLAYDRLARSHLPMLHTFATWTGLPLSALSYRLTSAAVRWLQKPYNYLIRLRRGSKKSLVLTSSLRCRKQGWLISQFVRWTKLDSPRWWRLDQFS